MSSGAASGAASGASASAAAPIQSVTTEPTEASSQVSSVTSPGVDAVASNEGGGGGGGGGGVKKTGLQLLEELEKKRKQPITSISHFFHPTNDFSTEEGKPRWTCPHCKSMCAVNSSRIQAHVSHIDSECGCGGCMIDEVPLSLTVAFAPAQCDSWCGSSLLHVCSLGQEADVQGFLLQT